MAVGGSLVVLGLAEGKIASEGTGAGIELDLDNVSDGLGGEALLLGAVGLNEEGEGLGNADGVRKLHAGTLAESGLDDGLGHPTAGVGGRAIDLGGVLSGEGSATVGTPTAVGVNDDLTAGEAGISLRSTDDELATGVDVEVAGGLVVDGEGGLAGLELDALEGLDDDVVVDELVHLGHGGGNLLLAGVGGAVVLAILLLGALGLGGLGVLGGDDDGVDLDGGDGSIGVLLVLDGDLGLAIGTEPPEGAILADIGELLAELGGKKVGEGHGRVGLVGGVAEHDTLITGTNIEVGLANVDAAGNVGGLLVDADKDLAGVAGETLGLDGAQIILEGVEANLADLSTDDLLVIEVGGGGDLTKDLSLRTIWRNIISIEQFQRILAGGFANRFWRARGSKMEMNKNQHKMC